MILEFATTFEAAAALTQKEVEFGAHFAREVISYMSQNYGDSVGCLSFLRVQKMDYYCAARALLDRSQRDDDIAITEAADRLMALDARAQTLGVSIHLCVGYYAHGYGQRVLTTMGWEEVDY